jgi:hypothetical protein
MRLRQRLRQAGLGVAPASSAGLAAVRHAEAEHDGESDPGGDEHEAEAAPSETVVSELSRVDAGGRDDGRFGEAGTEPGKPRVRHPESRLGTSAIPAEGSGRRAGGDGLCLDVDDDDAKRWAPRTVARGRRRDIGLGRLSYVTLAEALEAARRPRKVARSGGDPVADRDRDKRRSISVGEGRARRPDTGAIEDVAEGPNIMPAEQGASTRPRAPGPA